MVDSVWQEKITQLANQLNTKQLTLGTAESCTGGGLSYALTSTPGSSTWFECGLVTYSLAAKMSLLGVKQSTLDEYSAVSQETAKEMVDGLLERYPIDIGVAITGLAGPGGGSLAIPVGTVWIACKRRAHVPHAAHYLFTGDRETIREKSIAAAIDLLLRQISDGAR